MTKPGDQATHNEPRRRSAFRFSLVGLRPGTQLQYISDENITCNVKDERRVEFRGEARTLSGAAMIVARGRGYKGATIAGPRYWKYDGKRLSDMRGSPADEN